MTVKYSSCWLLNSHCQVISHVAEKLRLLFSQIPLHVRMMIDLVLPNATPE